MFSKLFGLAKDIGNVIEPVIDAPCQVVRQVTKPVGDAVQDVYGISKPLIAPIEYRKGKDD